jgi:hypothetical protein
MKGQLKMRWKGGILEGEDLEKVSKTEAIQPLQVSLQAQISRVNS